MWLKDWKWPEFKSQLFLLLAVCPEQLIYPLWTDPRFPIYRALLHKALLWELNERMHVKYLENLTRSKCSIMGAHASRDHRQFHYWGINHLLDWQNCIGQSIACGWNHHSDENYVEIKAPGRRNLNHLQSAHSSLHCLCSHDPSHSEKLSRKGEDAEWKLFWAGAPTMPRRLSTVPGTHIKVRINLNWFFFPLILNHVHKAKWIILYITGIELSVLHSLVSFSLCNNLVR